MDELKNFKNIADGEMEDLIVSSELKKRTLDSCKEKVNRKKPGFLVPAAVLIMVLAVSISSWKLFFGPSISGPGQNNVGVVDNNKGEGDGLPVDDPGASSGSSLAPWEIGTMAEAEKWAGGNLPMPSFIPSDFKLKEVWVPRDESVSDEGVSLQYMNDPVSFEIRYARIPLQVDKSMYKAVDINGMDGYISYTSPDPGVKESRGFVDLSWQRDGITCRILGELTEDQALKTARSIK